MTNQMSGRASTQPPVSSMAVGFTAFAAVVMMMAGASQAFQGLVALLNDNFYVVGQKWTFSFDLTTWGWVHLIVGALVAVAGVFVLRGGVWARAVGVAVAAVSALLTFMWLPYQPIWSMLIIALDVVVIWALTAHGTSPGKYFRGPSRRITAVFVERILAVDHNPRLASVQLPKSSSVATTAGTPAITLSDFPADSGQPSLLPQARTPHGHRPASCGSSNGRVTMHRMDNSDSSPAPTGPADLSTDRGEAHEVREIDEVVDRLVNRFPGIGAGRVREVVDAVHQRFEGNPIRDFVPVFVERAAADVLTDAASN